MKITYPECQIEISVDEVIELNNYYEEQKTVITCRPPELHGLNPVDFDKFRLNVKDKEWLEETLKDSLGKLHKQLLDSTDPNRHGDGIEHLIHEEPAPESQDPEHQPAPVPYPKEEETAPLGSTKEVKKKKSSGKMKKVDILFDTGWKTFGSLTAAAKAIDARLNHLSHALMTGKTCNGHHVRYSNPELDAALAEIEEGKKKPYQTTPPVR